MLSWLWSKGHYYRTARVVILTSLFWLSLNLILLSVANSGDGGIFARGGFEGGGSGGGDGQRMLEMRGGKKNAEEAPAPRVVKTGEGAWLRDKVLRR